MVKVKIIKAEFTDIEDRINNVIEEIMASPDHFAEIRDIKLIHIGGSFPCEEAMIIYNVENIDTVSDLSAELHELLSGRHNE